MPHIIESLVFTIRAFASKHVPDIGNRVTILWMSSYRVTLVILWDAVDVYYRRRSAIVWAFFWWRLVDDNPSERIGWRKQEKQALDDRLREEQIGIKPVNTYIDAFKSRTVTFTVPSSDATLEHRCIWFCLMWLPSIINAAPQMGMVRTGCFRRFL